MSKKSAKPKGSSRSGPRSIAVRPSVFVHLLPAMIPPGALDGGVAVVLDVLRATSSMVHALAAGAEAIIPCLEIEDARKAAGDLPPGSAVLAGERQGLPIEGFDLGNSPAAFTPEAVSGKVVVMTTTNGTRALHAAMSAERVLVAGFVNLGATVETLKLDGRPIHILCSGTEGEVSLEDTLLAGAIAHQLDSWGWDQLGPMDEELEGLLANDSAEIAASLWREAEVMIEEGGCPLYEFFIDGRGGRRVQALGLVDDIIDASAVNRFPFAAELHRDPLRVVPADGTGPRLRLFGAGGPGPT